MAATVNLGQQLFSKNVKHLPPRPPSVSRRPFSGGFHNRGRLFPTLKREHDPGSAASEQATTEDGLSTTSYTSQPTHVSALPKQRHVQSAKAQLEMAHPHKTENNQLDVDYALVVPGNDLAVYDVNRNLVIDRKPAKRNSRESTSDLFQDNHHGFLGKSASRPSSAKSLSLNSAPVSPAVDSRKNEDSVPDDLKPSVFGYMLKRQVYGSNPNIFTSSLLALQPGAMFKLDGHGGGHCKGECNGDNSRTTGTARNIPSHMEPLHPWLHQTMSQEVIGADPAKCLVFLPLNQSYDDLPIVPLL
ncbi:uncharacterized protein [Littorina saxatilis]|uniref:Uncharacterized protein n=1 Tax=Littorina saxatilis TaxID=31220 RepID=A0AAN9BTL6_9CAEN